MEIAVLNCYASFPLCEETYGKMESVLSNLTNQGDGSLGIMHLPVHKGMSKDEVVASAYFSALFIAFFCKELLTRYQVSICEITAFYDLKIYRLGFFITGL